MSRGDFAADTGPLRRHAAESCLPALRRDRAALGEPTTARQDPGREQDAGDPGISSRARALVAWILFAALLVPWPARAIAQEAALPAGVEVRELERDGRTIWLYMPSQREPRGLVVVPPAGGTLLTAPALSEGDRPEHTPYVEAGYAVVTTSLSGTLRGSVAASQVRDAIVAFAEARGGVRDLRRAIDVAIDEVPALASRPLFAAGHSSAATLVLSLAAVEPRLRAVAAYAPAADTKAFLAGSALAELAAREAPAALESAWASSPLALASKIDVPTLLFQAEDDDVTSIDDTRTLAARLSERGVLVRLVTVSGGGHYDAMIEAGIPAGIAWLGAHAPEPVD